jgi:hypothetical protein
MAQCCGRREKTVVAAAESDRLRRTATTPRVLSRRWQVLREERGRKKEREPHACAIRDHGHSASKNVGHRGHRHTHDHHHHHTHLKRLKLIARTKKSKRKRTERRKRGGEAQGANRPARREVRRVRGRRHHSNRTQLALFLQIHIQTTRTCTVARMYRAVTGEDFEPEAADAPERNTNLATTSHKLIGCRYITPLVPAFSATEHQYWSPSLLFS